ncbi:hypothetical protein [Vreelandella rituensis]|uniref:hypothetical protein n=1 Tax=Vreelandella rituensis TaxID=2282306 RepID=UPI0015F067BD|nr:hypothetical protein [Halomonas rituensis]
MAAAVGLGGRPLSRIQVGDYLLEWLMRRLGWRVTPTEDVAGPLVCPGKVVFLER